jgi:hypothetical protein
VEEGRKSREQQVESRAAEQQVERADHDSEVYDDVEVHDKGASGTHAKQQHIEEP